MLYILDTDHISLLQRGHQHLIQNLSRVDIVNRAVTVITVAEQLQGRMAVIRRAQSEVEAVRAFANLQHTFAFYQAVRVLPYDDVAAAKFEQFRRQKLRIGTQDLRIAVIALSYGATLITRNTHDFAQVPGLTIEDWSGSDIV